VAWNVNGIKLQAKGECFIHLRSAYCISGTGHHWVIKQCFLISKGSSFQGRIRHIYTKKGIYSWLEVAYRPCVHFEHLPVYTTPEKLWGMCTTWGNFSQLPLAHYIHGHKVSSVTYVPYMTHCTVLNHSQSDLSIVAQ